MKNIAITGSFSSGKSYVLDVLKGLGYSTFSCDEYVASLYKKNGFWKVVREEIYGLEENSKKKLADIIFNKKEQKRKLEKIIHPQVRCAIKVFEEKNRSEDLVFTEVPLLFESNIQNLFYKIICVFCTEDIRWKRADKRGIKDKDLYEKISNSQMPIETKKERSDFLLDSEQEIGRQIEKIIQNIKKGES